MVDPYTKGNIVFHRQYLFNTTELSDLDAYWRFGAGKIAG